MGFVSVEMTDFCGIRVGKKQGIEIIYEQPITGPFSCCIYMQAAHSSQRLMISFRKILIEDQFGTNGVISGKLKSGVFPIIAPTPLRNYSPPLWYRGALGYLITKLGHIMRKTRKAYLFSCKVKCTAMVDRYFRLFFSLSAFCVGKIRIASVCAPPPPQA